MEKKIKVCVNGPYMVSGNVPMDKQIIGIGKEGEPEKWIQGEKYPQKEQCDLCRCGQTKNKPFCDGTHIDAGFDDGSFAKSKKLK